MKFVTFLAAMDLSEAIFLLSAFIYTCVVGPGILSAEFSAGSVLWSNKLRNC